MDQLTPEELVALADFVEESIMRARGFKLSALIKFQRELNKREK